MWTIHQLQPLQLVGDLTGTASTWPQLFDDFIRYCLDRRFDDFFDNLFNLMAKVLLGRSSWPFSDLPGF